MPEVLPSLTETFGWDRIPGSAILSRGVVFESERKLKIDPEKELASFWQLCSDIASSVPSLFENSPLVSSEIFARPEALFAEPRPIHWKAKLPEDEVQKQLSVLRERYLLSEIDLVLSDTGQRNSGADLLAKTLRDPNATQSWLSCAQYPSNDEWRNRHLERIEKNWASAAAKEFVARQTEAPHPVTPEFVRTYGERRSELMAEFDRRIATMPDPPDAKMLVRDFGDLTCGCEIECYFPGEVPYVDAKPTIRRALEKIGLKCGDRPDQWQIGQELSIKRFPDDPRIEHPEVVSPILRGPEIEEQIRRAMHALAHLGCEVNETCALHVGIGHADGFSLAQAKAVLLNASALESTIDPLVQPHRRTNHPYHSSVHHLERCRNPYLDEKQVVEKFAQTVLAAPSLTELQRVTGCAGKGTNVNLNKLTLNYVEFRQLHGTLNPEVVLDWLAIHSDVVYHALREPEKRPTLPCFPPGYTLGDGILLDTDMQKAIERAQALADTAREGHPLELTIR